MNELQIFNSEEFGDIRTVTIENEPMFCLSDVCKALGLTQPSKVKDRLNEKGVNTIPTLTAGGEQKLLYINESIAMEEQVKTAQSDIKVQEKRRADLVYNLADCVKQYDAHEADTLKAVVDGRGKSGDIENVATAITAVSEAYPELKSNENYKQLMNELSITENMIAEYRSNFNKQVKQYNRYVRKFPTSIFLNVTGYEKQSYSYLEYDVSEDAPQNLFGDK